jgi:DNA-binding PadR family transcriptional regulator
MGFGVEVGLLSGNAPVKDVLVDSSRQKEQRQGDEERSILASQRLCQHGEDRDPDGEVQNVLGRPDLSAAHVENLIPGSEIEIRKKAGEEDDGPHRRWSRSGLPIPRARDSGSRALAILIFARSIVNRDPVATEERAATDPACHLTDDTLMINILMAGTRHMKDPDRLPLTPLSFQILVALADGPRHGYGIIKEIEAVTGEAFPSSTGTLYLAIERLEHEGLIEKEKSSDRRRRFYRLTALGRETAAGETRRLATLVGVARGKKLVGGRRFDALLLPKKR